MRTDWPIVYTTSTSSICESVMLFLASPFTSPRRKPSFIGEEKKKFTLTAPLNGTLSNVNSVCAVFHSGEEKKLSRWTVFLRFSHIFQYLLVFKEEKGGMCTQLLPIPLVFTRKWTICGYTGDAQLRGLGQAAWPAFRSALCRHGAAPTTAAFGGPHPLVWKQPRFPAIVSTEGNLRGSRVHRGRRTLQHRVPTNSKL